MKLGASRLNPSPRDDTARVAMTPALEAETERLLSLRTRDIRFSPEMVRAYREKDWPQRSKIARAWMIWVGLISMARRSWWVWCGEHPDAAVREHRGTPQT